MAILGALLRRISPQDRCALPQRILDFDRLLETARAHTAAYESAEPFPHVVLDGFIDAATVARVAGEFPDREARNAWLDYNGADETGKPLQFRKYHISDEDRLGPVTQRLLYELKSARFLEVLRVLTGIENLKIGRAHV